MSNTTMTERRCSDKLTEILKQTGFPHQSEENPTYGLALDWAYDVMNVYIMAFPDTGSQFETIQRTFSVHVFTYMINCNVHVYNLRRKDNDKIAYFLSYHNAIEAGLIYALTSEHP